MNFTKSIEKWTGERVNGVDIFEFELAVIGAGHAGIEAALAAARLGVRTVLFTINLDAVGNMPCNPCLGGSAKGHLIREIDALGGEMGRAADDTFIQFRMLHRSRGPAVHSPRVQVDRRDYQRRMKHCLERQENLELRQAEITEILTDEKGAVCAVRTKLGATYHVKAAVCASGTYLRGRIIVGDVAYDGGPDGMFAAGPLSGCLERLGVKLLRFKTGTPARVNRRSIDYTGLEVQEGDERIVPLSFEHRPEDTRGNLICCHLTYTNERTHEVIRRNIHRSPIYGGLIEGIGPRYCPSIEDKIMRFPDKERHQLFLEPMGLDTEEVYVQGCSSSLPEEVQNELMRTIPGLEHASVMRPAYAIEYDCADPTQMLHTLEFKEIPGLYGAGQFNGTSGYEEAAAQGLVAGINAARKLRGKGPFVLTRDSSYIGTLIDDLVIKGTNEPYRMMTSRSEYRLLLRQENADFRLTPLGYEVGLVSEERYRACLAKYEAVEREIARLSAVSVGPGEALRAYLEAAGGAGLTTGAKLAELLRRPGVTYEGLASFDKGRPELPQEVREEAEIMVKYEGYIRRQQAQAAAAAKLEGRRLPEGIDYQRIKGLRLEARQKLSAMRPETVGQASRISGVSPADITVLLIYLEQRRRSEDGRFGDH